MRRFNHISIILSIVMLSLITGNILILSDLQAATADGLVTAEWMGWAVAVILIVSGLIHIFGLTNLAAQFKHFRNDKLLRSAAFVIGFLSLFFIAADTMMLSDIGHEYLFGMDVSGEWRIVFTGQAIHILFAVLLLIQCTAAGRILKKKKAAVAVVKDESLFLTVNQIGVISSILGLICLLVLLGSGLPQTNIAVLSFFLYIVFLVPYGLAAACWFFTKRKEKPAEWYDEKQFADITRGALITLLLTTLLFIVFYFLSSFEIMSVPAQLLFPIYLFFSLLIFSGSTLYLNKNF